MRPFARPVLQTSPPEASEKSHISPRFLRHVLQAASQNAADVEDHTHRKAAHSEPAGLSTEQRLNAGKARGGAAPRSSELSP